LTAGTGAGPPGGGVGGRRERIAAGTLAHRRSPRYDPSIPSKEQRAARGAALGRWAKQRRVAALLLLLAPLLGGGRLIRDPVQIKIQGYIDPSEEQQLNPWAMLEVWLERPPNRRFALMNIIVLSPGAVSGGDILAAMQPIRPNIIFNGNREQLDEISTAQPNQYLQIVGYTVDGPRRILIQSVERSAPIVGPTPTTSLRERLFGF